MGEKKLTLKQKVFVNEYIIDGNATAAAARAGYKDPSKGRQLVTQSSISEAIARAFEYKKKASLITAEKVLQDIDLIRQDAMKIVDDKMADKQAALKACELLGKHLKMFTDKTEHTGNNGKDLFEKIEIILVDP